LPRTNNAIKQKNKDTILKLARSRLPEKQKAIYATHRSKHKNKVMSILHVPIKTSTQ